MTNHKNFYKLIIIFKSLHLPEGWYTYNVYRQITDSDKISFLKIKYRPGPIPAYSKP